MSQKNPNQTQQFEDFFEELSSIDELYYNESLETTDDADAGLTNENVRKLTDDILNPLPADDERY